jgi:shikimate dehydrogenase
MMQRYGLIGKKLGHSFSKAYFTEKFVRLGIPAVYDLLEIADISEILNVIKNHKPAGLNVTIPYKQAVIPYLDSLSEEAKAIGAVNTISFSATEGVIHTKGWNTDAPAFMQELSNFAGDFKGSALLLGTGGASAAAAYVLKKLGWDFVSVSRNPSSADQLSYQDLDAALIESHTLIINATPIGMYPDVSGIPEIPWEAVGEKHLLFDMVYNPEVTRFLQSGLERGAKVRNGLGMLTLQAELAWKTWQQSQHQ